MKRTRRNFKQRRQRRQRTRRIRGHSGGGGLYDFIINKPSEIPAQATLFWKSFMKGFGITTIAQIGNKVREHGIVVDSRLAPLSQIVLWHPVRGSIERALAGAKTTMRKEGVKAYLRSRDLSEPILLTTAVMATVPALASTDTIDALYVIPQLQVERDMMSSLIKKPENQIATRETIESIRAQIDEKVSTASVKLRSKPHFYKRCNEAPPCAVKFPLRDSNPFYLISSGQGRIQAIKEAVTELDMDPAGVSVELTIIQLNRNLCNLFIMVGNEFRLDGDFNDPRHEDDSPLIPTPGSCNPSGTSIEDVLSLFNEEHVEWNKRAATVKSMGVNAPPNVLSNAVIGEEAEAEEEEDPLRWGLPF